MKEGAPLTADKFKQLDLPDGVCQLIISDPIPSDTGAYACIAENKVKREQTAQFVEFEGRDEYIRNLTAPAEEEEEAPKPKKVTMRKGKAGKGKAAAEDGAPVDKKLRLKFVSHLNDRMVPVGSKMKLMCIVDGPEPNIKWTRNGMNIVFTPRVKNLSKEGTALVEFLTVLPEDVGEWKCAAKNAAGEISTVCNLTVFELPPTDIIPPTFSRPISGKVLRMYCRRVRWMSWKYIEQSLCRLLFSIVGMGKVISSVWSKMKSCVVPYPLPFHLFSARPLITHSRLIQ